MKKLIWFLSMVVLFAATQSHATDLDDVQREQEIYREAFGEFSKPLENAVMEDYIKEKIDDQVNDRMQEMMNE